MCDAQEAHFVVRALIANGGWARLPMTPASGFFVCQADPRKADPGSRVDRAVGVLREEGLPRQATCAADSERR